MINNWFINNKLYLNIKKTNYLIYNNLNDGKLYIYIYIYIYICIGNNVIDQVDYMNLC